MGYPWDKTYLEKIRENPQECESIRSAFYTLRKKYINDNPDISDEINLSIQEQFRLLGEAFELESAVLDGCTDEWHFLWDVLDALLGTTWDNEKKMN